MRRQFAGTKNDADGDALFWIWERVPLPALDHPAGAVLWASAASLAIPVAYFVSLSRSFVERPKENMQEVCCVYMCVHVCVCVCFCAT